MEGNLQKWTNFVLGWQERYFKIKGSLLLYYFKKDQPVKGKIHLSVSNINITNNDYRFEIDTGTSIFYLRTTTKEKKEEWVKALKLAKFEAEGKNININNNNISSLAISDSIKMTKEISMQNDSRPKTIPDDKLTKKIGFIKSLTENIQNLNLNFEKFLIENKQNFKPENYAFMNEFLNIYKVKK
jgi:hypothetical protein